MIDITNEEQRIRSRIAFQEAVGDGITASRNNANKWDPLYRWFASDLAMPRGGNFSPIGKLITEDKQIGNRIDEMRSHKPVCAVICLLPGVDADEVVRKLRLKQVSSLRTVLFLDETTPTRLMSFGSENEPTTQRLSALFDSLPVEVHPALGVPDDAPPPPPLGSAFPVAMLPIAVDARVERMLRIAVSSSTAVLLVGPPGTGKTTLLRQLIEQVQESPTLFGFTEPMAAATWVTPHEGWTTQDLIGGETLENGELVFRPGWVLSAIGRNSWLVLDEANRADMDRIFGGLLTWLSGGEPELGQLTTDPESPFVTLGWADGPTSVIENQELLGAPTDTYGEEAVRYLAGQEWRLLGTYNAVDAQRVFRFGQALGRRFVQVPIPAPDPEQLDAILKSSTLGVAEDVLEALSSIYSAHYESTDTRLGPAPVLRMPDYIRAGVATAAEPLADSFEDDGVARQVDEAAHELLAEAYLLNVGPFLSRLDDPTLEALRDRLVEREAVFDSAAWAWITAMIESYR